MALPVFSHHFEDSLVLSMKNLSPSDTAITVPSECFSQLASSFAGVCRIEEGCLSLDCSVFEGAEQIRLLAQILNCSRDGSLAVGLVRAQRLFVSVVDN